MPGVQRLLLVWGGGRWLRRSSATGQ